MLLKQVLGALKTVVYLQAFILFCACRVPGVVYKRNRDCDDLHSDVTLSLPRLLSVIECARMCLAEDCSAFFFNTLNLSCSTQNVVVDKSLMTSSPGTQYFVAQATSSEITIHGTTVNGPVSTTSGTTKPSASSPAPTNSGTSCSSQATSNSYNYAPNVGLCYLILENFTPWTGAKSSCENYGPRYRLVVVNTNAKWEFLATNILSGDSYWIGLNENGWVDGSILSYTMWALGNFWPPSSSGNCARMDKNVNYEWTWDHCNSARSYICEEF